VAQVAVTTCGQQVRAPLDAAVEKTIDVISTIYGSSLPVHDDCLVIAWASLRPCAGNLHGGGARFLMRLYGNSDTSAPASRAPLPNQIGAGLGNGAFDERMQGPQEILANPYPP
jgi:hypothetical protein